MSNFILPSKVRSKVTQDITWVTVDLETVYCPAKRKYIICEMSFYDIFADKEIWSCVIKPDGDYYLNLWRKEKGYTDEVLSNAKSIDYVDRFLPYLCGSFILCFWNKESDLNLYPKLETYALETRCVMKRYSSNYGDYDPRFGDRRYAKLKDAAFKSGFVLNKDEFFHSATVDAKATAHVWRFCDEAELPAPSLSLDLVERSEIERFYKEFLEIKDKKIVSLENKLTQSHDDLAEEEVTIPF